MGAKKQCQTILTGSLKTHWMMYINYVNISVNCTDAVGMNNANYMVRMITSLSSKFI